MATYTQPDHYYKADDKSDYIREIYDLARESQLSALESEYDAQVTDFDAAEQKLPATYQAAKNSTAADAEMSRASLNSSLAASGINSGAGSQARLAQSNALQSDLSSLDADRASAKTDLDAQRLAAQQSYRSAVAQAIVDNEFERAQALYSEAVRVDNSFTSVTKKYSGGNPVAGKNTLSDAAVNILNDASRVDSTPASIADLVEAGLGSGALADWEGSYILSSIGY